MATPVLVMPARCLAVRKALDARPTHGGGRRRTLFLIPPGGGKEPGFVPMGFPVGSQQSQRIFGQGTYRSLAPLPRWTWTWSAGRQYRRPEGRGLHGAGGPSYRR